MSIRPTAAAVEPCVYAYFLKRLVRSSSGSSAWPAAFRGGSRGSSAQLAHLTEDIVTCFVRWHPDSPLRQAGRGVRLPCDPSIVSGNTSPKTWTTRLRLRSSSPGRRGRRRAKQDGETPSGCHNPLDAGLETAFNKTFVVVVCQVALSDHAGRLEPRHGLGVSRPCDRCRGLCPVAVRWGGCPTWSLRCRCEDARLGISRRPGIRSAVADHR